MHQWVTHDRNGSIDNVLRPGPGSMMHPTINEEKLLFCFNDRILFLGGGEGKENGPFWQFCPTTEESLKNALEVCKEELVKT